jgi:hypothetical protein
MFKRSYTLFGFALFAVLIVVIALCWRERSVQVSTYPDGVVAQETTVQWTLLGGHDVVSVVGKLHDGTVIHYKTELEEWFKDGRGNSIGAEECHRLHQDEMDRIIEETH